MRTPTAAELLDVWDAGLTTAPLQRPLLFVRAVMGGDASDALHLNLAARDRLLIELRERLFGNALIALERCPSCREPLEVSLAMSDLLASPAPASVPLAPPAPPALPEVIEARSGDYQVRCRLPHTADLLAAAECETVEAARALLIERCTLTAERNGHTVAPANLPVEVVAAMTASLSDACPLANVDLTLRCHACDTTWTSILDIGAFLWREIDSWAIRTLRDVSALARAYGWSEREILSLSPQRRQHYLEVIAGG